MIKRDVSLSYDIENLSEVKELFTVNEDLWDNVLSDVVNNLCAVGVESAKKRFSEAQYDGKNDVRVWKVSPRKQTDEHIATFVAKGKSLPFIEYGAGVYYNNPREYPDLPKNVLGIGEYGKHRGRRRTWYYYEDDGTLDTEGQKKKAIKTHGNPANACMYHAMKDIESSIQSVVEEAFRDANL